MSIKLNVHSVDAEKQSAVISLFDGNDAIISMKNIQIGINEDGTANTIWLNEFTKRRVASSRASKVYAEENII